MSSPESYKPSDRRPIKSRNLGVFQWLAGVLVRAKVSPNAISLLSMLWGALAGGLFFATGFSGVGLSGWQMRLAWVAAAGCMQLRLIANLLDGMVAVGRGIASPLGELYNELPDRFSDAVILIGAGYAANSEPVLGYLAACGAILTAYVRAMGKTMGVGGLFMGPMSKSQRMATLTATALVLAIWPEQWQLVWGQASWGIMAVALALIFLGSLVTVARRLARLVHTLKRETN